MRAALGGALLTLACAGPAELPRPALPLTPTPDAPFRARPPAVLASEPEVPNARLFALDNGMSIVVVERHDLPIVALELVNRDAHDDGTRAGRGLAKLTARLLNEGTRFSKGEVFRHLRIDGVFPHSLVSPEASFLGVSVPAAGLEKGLGLMARIVRNPTFDQPALEDAQDAVGGAIYQQANLARYQLRDLALTALAGPEHPAIDAPLGAAENLAHFSQTVVRRFYEEHYGPEDAALVAVGDVDFDRVLALARQDFGDWQKRTPRAAAAPPALAYVNVQPAIQGLDGREELAWFVLALPCPAASDLHLVDADLLGMLLADLSLPGSAREFHGGSYPRRIDAACEQHPGFGVFVVEFAVETVYAGEALGAVQREIERLRGTPASADALSVAKSRYLAAWAPILASNRGTAGVLAECFADGLPPNELALVLERVKAATAEDLRETATRYFNGRIGIAVFGAHELLEPELMRFGGAKWWNAVGSSGGSK
jgi:zinc protease